MGRLGMVVTLGLALGAVHPGAALAGKKAKLTARINHKAFKANLKPSITGTYTTTGVIMNGLFQKIRIAKGTVKILTIICAVDNIAAATLPVTVDCGGTYSDNTFSGPNPPSDPKAWASATGLQVTFKTFAAGRVTGTFAGSLAPGDTNPTDPAATIEKGKFAMTLLSGS